jgi:hypothetical protein
MESKPVRTKYDAELNELSRLHDDLERLAKKHRGRDGKVVTHALESLREHIKTTEDLRTLARKLIEIENEHESESKNFPDHIGKVDLSAAFMALEVLLDFLRGRVVSRNIGHLRNALIEIIVGAAPAAMLQPEKHDSGRRAQAPKARKRRECWLASWKYSCLQACRGNKQLSGSLGMSRQKWDKKFRISQLPRE